MTSVEIEAKGYRDTIQISLKYPSVPNLTYNFSLQVNIFKQKLPSITYQRVHHNTYSNLKRFITVTDLEYSSMYKVEIKNKYSDKDWVTKNVFTNTPANLRLQPSQNQENQLNQNNFQLNQSQWRRPKSVNVKKTGRSQIKKEKAKDNVNVNEQLCNSELLLKMIGKSSNLQNKDKLHKYILESRKCKNIEEFVNEKGDRRRDRQMVMDKKKLLVQGMLFFNDIYRKKEGHNYFKNDWFMGPFYSYDYNQSQIKRQ